MISKRWLLPAAAAAVMSLGVLPSTAAADTVPRSPKPSWQTNGALDARFTNPTGAVYAVALGKGASAGLVFLGGKFSSLKPPRGAPGGAVARRGLAALDANTGALVAFDAQLGGPTVDVRSLELSEDGATLYVGGKFDSVRGAPRKNLAAVEARTGAPRGFVANAAAPVKALVVRGDRLWIGGEFNVVSGQRRLKLAQVHSGTGAVSGWRADVTQQGGKPCPPRCLPTVTALDLSGDAQTVYVGGSFAFVNGVPRNSAAALDTRTGGVRAFNPNVYLENNKSSLNRVYGLEVYGDRVFLCGDFYRVDGASRPNVAAVDPVTGRNKAGWTSSTDGAVNACEISPVSGFLYIGGHFDRVGGPAAGQGAPGAKVRRHIAKLNPSTGVPVDGFDPVMNSSPGVYSLDSGFNRLVAGGQFTTVNGLAQQGVAVFG